MKAAWNDLSEEDRQARIKKAADTRAKNEAAKA